MPKHPKLVTPGKHVIEGTEMDHIEVTLTPTHLEFRKVSSKRTHRVLIEKAARHAAMMEDICKDMGLPPDS
jgi:hypothetical protein